MLDTMRAGQIMLDTIRAGQIMLDTMRAGQIMLDTIRAGQIMLDTMRAGQIMLDTIRAGQIMLDTMRTGQYDRWLGESRIMAASSAAECKNVGHKVSNFDMNIWKDKCKDIMIDELTAKFSQNRMCFKVLEATNNTVLVESSPYDKL